MLMGLFSLIGTLAAGFLTDWPGLINVLNTQAVGYMVAGLLVLLVLSRGRICYPSFG